MKDVPTEKLNFQPLLFSSDKIHAGRGGTLFFDGYTMWPIMNQRKQAVQAGTQSDRETRSQI